MGTKELLWAGGKAFIVSLVLTPIVRDVFRAYNVVDRPGRRKVHAYPIPRVGGLPIMAGYLFALWGMLAQVPFGHSRLIWRLFPGAAAIFLTGLIDDFFNLRPRVKLMGQIAAAGLAWWFGLRLEAIGGMAVPVWIGLPLSIFWLLLATNALNLIDGLDGLCSGMGFFATLAFFFVSVVRSNAALGYVTLPLAGALLGFLFYNFNPATVFLGDSGALSIGFLTGCFGLIWLGQATTLAGSLVPLFALAVPLLDVALSIVRRTLNGQPIFAADRGHVHHRLLDRGLSVRRGALVLYAVAAAGGLFAILLSYRPVAMGYHGVVVLGFCVACYAGIRELRYPELEVAARLLFRGGFRRAFADRLRIEKLAEALAAAKSEDAWWQALLKAGESEGWAGVNWTGCSTARDRRLTPGSPRWSFEVAIGEAESVRIDGGDESRTGLDLQRLSQVLQATLTARRSGLGQPALP